MIDVFQEVRERVPAQNAARYYGLTFDRKGWAVCPFHSDKHPSMSFKNGRFRCWACNASGDSIDFTGKLLGLEPLAAAERLNADFGLNLPLHRKPTPAEMQTAQRRREISELYKDFEQWRDGMIRQLCKCFRLAHEALKGLATPADLDKLSDAQTLAIREQARIEWLADVLTDGTMAEQMQAWRERGRILRLIERILNSTPMSSNVA